MTILICGNYTSHNNYLQLLSDAYQKEGNTVIFGIENFYYSKFIPDIVHIHWPEVFYRWNFKLPISDETTEFILDRLNHFKKNSAKLVFTLHNTGPRKNTRIDEDIFKIFLKKSDILVHHGEFSRNHFISQLPDKKHIICNHGPYDIEEKNYKNERKAWKVPDNKFVILIPGRQTGYKNTGIIRSVINDRSLKDVLVLIAGSVKTPRNVVLKSFFKIAAFLREKHNFSRKVKKISRMVTEDEMASLISACDMVFLGHKEGLTTGIIPHAISYGKAVVYPDIGNFKYQAHGYNYAVKYTASNINSARSAILTIKKELSENDYVGKRLENSEWMALNSWKKYVTNVIDAANKLND